MFFQDTFKKIVRAKTACTPYSLRSSERAAWILRLRSGHAPLKPRGAGGLDSQRLGTGMGDSRSGMLFRHLLFGLFIFGHVSGIGLGLGAQAYRE